MSKPKKAAGLSAKQRAFVEAYFQTGEHGRWNATEAARIAGYAHPNKQGPRLLVNVGIKAAIERRLAEMKMDADEVLIRLAETARFDPLQFMEVNETDAGEQLVYIDLVAIKKAGLGSVVKKISYDKYGRMVVEFHDSQAAQRLIGQHHKLFTQRHEVESPQLAPLPDILKDLIGKVYGGQS
jgi:phage terminase small subunit